MQATTVQTIPGRTQVITPQAQPKPRKGYPARFALGVGCTQIIIGALCIVFQVLKIHLNYWKICYGLVVNN